MTDQTTVEKIEAKADAIAKDIAADVKEVVTKAKSKVEYLVEGKVEPAEERVRVDLVDSEKLIIRNIENEFLKAQVELQRLAQETQRLSGVTQQCSKDFLAKLEEYTTKYGIDKVKMVFDNIELAFKKKA